MAGISLRWRDLFAVGCGYLIGSLPVGLWLGKLQGGVDVRDYGSGATGATNVLRTLGPKAAAATLSMDMAKGSVAVLSARAISHDAATSAAAGVAAVAGHSWPVWAQYRGGKGAATAFGALAAVSPQVAACTGAVGVATLAVTRRASVGSLNAAAAAVVCSAAIGVRRRKWVPLAYSVLVTAIIVGRHKDNIRRLLAGTEPELGEKATKSDEG
jgi:glycerol-3-phosphate acyltransferase PlsY